MTGPQASHGNFDSIIDDFLGSHNVVGKRSKRVLKVAPQTGLEQLDEIVCVVLLCSYECKDLI